ncbi:hypothetical protein V8E53_000959 [Lactarius tabidus]
MLVYRDNVVIMHPDLSLFYGCSSGCHCKFHCGWTVGTRPGLQTDTNFGLRLHPLVRVYWGHHPSIFSLGQLLYAASMGARVLGMFGMITTRSGKQPDTVRKWQLASVHRIISSCRLVRLVVRPLGQLEVSAYDFAFRRCARIGSRVPKCGIKMGCGNFNISQRATSLSEVIVHIVLKESAAPVCGHKLRCACPANVCSASNQRTE